MTSDDLFEDIPHLIMYNGKPYHLQIHKHFISYVLRGGVDYLLFDGLNCIHGKGLNNILQNTKKTLRKYGFTDKKGKLLKEFT